MKLAIKLSFSKRCLRKLQKRAGRVLQISLIPVVPPWALL